MNGPKRLKDDPSFQWETGVDLGAEAERHAGVELSGLRERLLAAAVDLPPAAAPAPRRPGLGALGGAGALLLAGLGGYWLGTGAPEAGLTPRVPASAVAPAATVEAPLLAVDPAPAAAESPRALPAPILAAPPATAPVRAKSSPPPAAPVAAGQVDAPLAEEPARPTAAAGSAEPSPPAVAAPAAAPSPAASGLAEELSAYDRAKLQAEQGDAVAAIAGFQDYLLRWPGGRLEREARLGLVAALHAEGAWEELLPQVEALRALGTSGARSSELRDLEAEALVRLGRCGEAWALVDADPKAAFAAQVRRECRRR